MQRYVLHLNHVDGLIVDEEGSEHHNLDAARQEADVGIREIAAEYLRMGRNLTS